MGKTTSTDILVIGGGIAGVSLAAELSRTHKVAVLERESQPGYHATGRSAAVFSESYGAPVIRALSRASRDFFTRPPEGFCAEPLLSPRGCLYIARHDQSDAFRQLLHRDDLAASARCISPEEALRHSPLLRPGYVAEALFDPGECDIDVHSLLQGYVRMLRHNGSSLTPNQHVTRIEHVESGWQVWTAEAGSWRAPVLINAAGAWSDQIAHMANVAGIGLSPRRRSALLIDVPGHDTLGSWPLTIDIDEQFYFKPDAGRLLLSPADETPSLPCDALPDDFDIALAVERFETATTMEVRRIHSSWAGLRSFVADRIPVIGPSRDRPAFFWYAAQGGYGIQISPALARVAAAMIRQESIPADILAAGVTSVDFLPRNDPEKI